MNIGEMHVWFRQYAQQMGMQNVRAILPEQIDILINTSITDTVNQIIRENVGVTNDRIITDNSKIGQINALKHLYKVKEIPFINNKVIHTTIFDNPDNTESGLLISYIDDPGVDPTVLTTITFVRFSYSIGKAGQAPQNVNITIPVNKLNDISYVSNLFSDQGVQVRYWNVSASNQVTGIKVIYDVKLESDFVVDLLSISCGYTTTEDTIEVETVTALANNFITLDEFETILIPVKDTRKVSEFDFSNSNFYNGLIRYKEPLNNYLFLVDFAIDYVDASKGILEDKIGNDSLYLNNFRTNLFPVRLIDDAYLADTLNDFILKPRLRSPIAVIVNGALDIYLGKLTGNNTKGYFLENNLIPYIIRMSYIAKPAVVKYSEDINGENVDCDLPDYMHVDILKHAVDLYRNALTGSIGASQQQEQEQQRELARNNYRNEGYQ